MYGDSANDHLYYYLLQVAAVTYLVPLVIFLTVIVPLSLCADVKLRHYQLMTTFHYHPNYIHCLHIQSQI